jgi:hypothetical protein
MFPSQHATCTGYCNIGTSGFQRDHNVPTERKGCIRCPSATVHSIRHSIRLGCAVLQHAGLRCKQHAVRCKHGVLRCNACSALQRVLNRPRPMLLSILRDSVALEQLARTCNRGEMLEGEMIEVAALSNFMSKPIPASIARTAVSASMSYLQPCTCHPLSLVPLPLSSLALLSRSPLQSPPLLSSFALSSPPRRAAPLLRQAVAWQGRLPERGQAHRRAWDVAHDAVLHRRELLVPEVRL